MDRLLQIQILHSCWDLNLLLLKVRDGNLLSLQPSLHLKDNCIIMDKFGILNKLQNYLLLLSIENSSFSCL